MTLVALDTKNVMPVVELGVVGASSPQLAARIDKTRKHFRFMVVTSRFRASEGASSPDAHGSAVPAVRCGAVNANRWPPSGRALAPPIREQRQNARSAKVSLSAGPGRSAPQLSSASRTQSLI